MKPAGRNNDGKGVQAAALDNRINGKERGTTNIETHAPKPNTANKPEEKENDEL